MGQGGHLEEHFNALLEELDGLVGFLVLHSASGFTIKFLDFNQLGHAFLKRNILATARTTHILGQVLRELEQINTVAGSAPGGPTFFSVKLSKN